MPSQPDLLATSLGDIRPEAGRTEPRLWVRRLVIWEAPGKQIRDVRLRPGLNIVWSPDSGKQGEPMGHGGGKTSFCRLIRYCLGEDSFASHMQRELIADRLPEGHVGAEIILDGRQWIVVRPIGVGNRHFCAEGGVLDDALIPEMANTGVAPLRQAITSALMDEAVCHIPVTNPSENGWEAALAWLTRDQECRLRDPLEWRVSQTQSQSPSQQLSRADRLVIVRLLIDSLNPDELAAAAEHKRLGREVESAKNRRKRLEWLIADLRGGLGQAFGGASDADDAQARLWEQSAAAKLKEEEGAVDPDLLEKLKQARRERRAEDEKLKAIEARLNEIEGELAVRDELKRIYDNNVAKAHTHTFDAENPICKTCGRGLDAAAQQFVQERRQELEGFTEQVGELTKGIEGLKNEKQGQLRARALSLQTLQPFIARVTDLERAMTTQSARLSQAKGHVAMTSRFAQHRHELTQLGVNITSLTKLQAAQAKNIIDLRRASASVIERLSQHFDAILRFLVPDQVTASVSLDDDDLALRLATGTERSTAAIDSLKIVAFDLAVMAMTIEGRTRLPAFLIHDSPREADLGRSIYDRLFHFARELEMMTDVPIFQYIVTTTTEPPMVYQNDPWLRLELHGAPSEKRLFAADL